MRSPRGIRVLRAWCERSGLWGDGTWCFQVVMYWPQSFMDAASGEEVGSGVGGRWRGDGVGEAGFGDFEGDAGFAAPVAEAAAEAVGDGFDAVLAVEFCLLVAGG